ncbi:hypothetical protein [uncultured Zoogloea sp.]|uniref:hypothetical protein n=1 Tax=uncultured Zoogloea sp. TaxID=160237 RepID=UPI0026172D13|nr:hypothetical protein [uncultured Zoogloea sp.]
MKICLLVFALMLAPLTSSAALHDRGSGLIYDDILNVTWFQNANFASSTIPYGMLDFNQAKSMVDAFSYTDPVSNVTYSDWRLPRVVDDSIPGCSFDPYGATNCGLRYGAGEMAILFYVTLGNLGFYDALGNQGQFGWGLFNKGPFFGLQTGNYWYDNLNISNPNEAWSFSFGFGIEYDSAPITDPRHLMILRSGDVAVVPEPSSSVLCGFGFTLLAISSRAYRKN